MIEGQAYKKSLFRRFFGCFTAKPMPELELIFKDEPSPDVMSDPTELYMDPGYVPPDILEPKPCAPSAEASPITDISTIPEASNDSLDDSLDASLINEPLLNPESSDDESSTKAEDMSHYYIVMYFIFSMIIMSFVNGR